MATSSLANNGQPAASSNEPCGGVPPGVPGQGQSTAAAGIPSGFTMPAGNPGVSSRLPYPPPYTGGQISPPPPQIGGTPGITRLPVPGLPSVPAGEEGNLYRALGASMESDAPKLKFVSKSKPAGLEVSDGTHPVGSMYCQHIKPSRRTHISYAFSVMVFIC